MKRVIYDTYESVDNGKGTLKVPFKDGKQESATLSITGVGVIHLAKDKLETVFSLIEDMKDQLEYREGT